MPAETPMLVLPARLTHAEAPDAVQMLCQALQRESGKVPGAGRATPAMVDASALQQFDSSALAVLLECRRVAQAAGRGLDVRHAPPKLQQLARLYGLDEVLGVASAESAQAPSL